MNNDLKFILIVVVVILGTLGGVMFYSNKSKSPNSKYTPWTTGSDSAKVKIVEYSDFQCPACAAAHKPLEEAVSKSNGVANLSYYYFPLPMHKNANPAAYAAQAAGLQGKFWEMGGLLFDKQADWQGLSDPKSVFDGYATQLGLDIVKFDTDLISSETKDKVLDSYQYGQSKKISETPTFFVNGEKVVGAKTLEEWQQIINDKSK